MIFIDKFGLAGSPGEQRVQDESQIGAEVRKVDFVNELVLVLLRDGFHVEKVRKYQCNCFTK